MLSPEYTQFRMCASDGTRRLSLAQSSVPALELHEVCGAGHSEHALPGERRWPRVGTLSFWTSPWCPPCVPPSRPRNNEARKLE